MITKEVLEKILVEQGVSPTADDEEIKSALLKANWKNGDVQSALVVWRENIKTHEKRVDAVQNLFRGKAKLSPSDINELLGIEMDIPPKSLTVTRARGNRHISYGIILEICVVSFILSVIFMFAAMWFFKIGFFHPVV